MTFPAIFRFISGEISAEIFFSNIIIAPKDSSLNSRGSLLSYFWAILLISALITILENFGSLLPARTVTVKREFFKILRKADEILRSVILKSIDWNRLTLVQIAFHLKNPSTVKPLDSEFQRIQSTSMLLHHRYYWTFKIF